MKQMQQSLKEQMQQMMQQMKEGGMPSGQMQKQLSEMLMKEQMLWNLWRIFTQPWIIILMEHGMSLNSFVEQSVEKQLASAY